MMTIEIRSNRINKPEKAFDVELAALNTLISHEMTIPSELDTFIKSVKQTGKVFWPVIVDKESHLILDGHHRKAGLTSLGYKYVPTAYVDYLNDSEITVGTWYPLVSQSIEVVIDALKKLKMKIRRIRHFNLKRVTKRKVTAIIGNVNQLYTVLGDRETIFHVIYDKWLKNIRYFDNPELCLDNTDEYSSAIIAWSYTKKEILEYVKTGKLYLPKTTRHEFPFNVAKCDVPLEKLNGKI